jgi:hypothetical protein
MVGTSFSMKMSSNDTDSITLLNTATIYTYEYGNLAICILGNIGNLLSALVFLQKPWRKNVCVFYFLVCLFLNSAYLNSVILGTAFIIGFNVNLQNSSSVLCKLQNYTALVFSTLLPTVLILASVDRLLISSQNVDTRLYSSKRLAYFSVGISTAFWIVFNSHILIKVNLQQFGLSHLVCDYDLSEVYTKFFNYSLMVFNCIFCILMIILSILSFKNVRRIRTIPRQQRTQIRSMKKRDFQLLRCLFVHDVVYISVSLVSRFYSAYETVTTHQIRTPLEDAIITFLHNIFFFIYFIFYCSSFFIFISVSKAFRYELKRLIYNLTPLREEENRQENMGPNNVELNIHVVSPIVIPS